jgi:two-component system, cell cycle response regulator DivK
MSDKTVLIVEDNEINLMLVRDIIRRLGHNTVEATDAETGVKLAAELCPDLILMDIRLPGMDGLKAVEILKADPETAGIPAIAISASAFERDRRAALAAGCETYITKPLIYDEFISAIENCLIKYDKCGYDEASDCQNVAMDK